MGAISNISSDCVEYLEKCFDAEDVAIMGENHVEQLKVYFIHLASDKVDEDFTLDNCQEVLDGEAEQDTMDVENDEGFENSEYDYHIFVNREPVETTLIIEEKEVTSDYVNDEQSSMNEVAKVKKENSSKLKKYSSSNSSSNLKQ